MTTPTHRPRTAWNGPAGATVRDRHVLTDAGRAVLGLPALGDVALVPLIDLPYRDDTRDLRGGNDR